MTYFFRFLCCFILFIFAAAPALSQDAAGHAGMVKTVSGDARIMRQAAETPAAPGKLLRENDLLATGPDGRLGFILTDGTVITLGPGSSFRIDAYLFQPEENAYDFSFFMEKGTALYNTGKISRLSPESVKLETPRATVGIRGTRFIVEVK